MIVRSRPRLVNDTWLAFLVIVGVWAACAGGVFINWILAPNECPESGFGCVLTPKDNVEFMALLFGVPVTIAWFCVGAIATTLLGRFSNLKWWWIALLSLGACLLVGVVTVRAIKRLI